MTTGRLHPTRRNRVLGVAMAAAYILAAPVVALATAGDLDTSMPRGSFSHTDTAGNNTLRFTGRVHRHALPPGTYQLTAVASSNRKTSKPKTASFRIVR